MHRLTLYSLFSWIWVFAMPAMADTKKINAFDGSEYVPQAQLVGKGTLKHLFWEVYEGELFAPLGKYQEGSPFALRLSYLRSLTGEAIAKASVEGMRKQGMNDEKKLVTWFNHLNNIFPNVKKGDQITGVVNDQGHSLFFQKGKKIGHVTDKQFTEFFFGIWLSEQTTKESFKQAILGNVSY